VSEEVLDKELKLRISSLKTDFEDILNTVLEKFEEMLKVEISKVVTGEYGFCGCVEDAWERPYDLKFNAYGKLEIEIDWGKIQRITKEAREILEEESELEEDDDWEDDDC
jgi:regulator of PEP synthase PpsR (kinase-PPPase family)